MSENNVVNVVNRNEPVSPSEVLIRAYENGASHESLTHLLDLQERFENREAEKAFNQALSDFKADMPKLVKDRDVKFGDTAYSHVSLANLVYSVSEVLSKYGLSHTWEASQSETMISVSCILSHRLGYKQKTTLSSFADSSGKKNAIQAIGSAVSYLQRYTLMSATGLAAWDQDDGVSAGASKFISFEQVQEIETLLADVGGDLQKLVEHFGVSSVNELPADRFNSIITTIRAKAKKGSTKPEDSGGEK